MTQNYSDRCIADLSDDDLAVWIDASRIVYELEDKAVRSRAATIELMSDEDRADFIDALYTESDRRSAIKTDAFIAHTIEQGEAAIADGRLNDVTSQRDRNRLLAIRCARIVKLVGANAPQAVIDLAEKLLGRIREIKT